MSYNFLFLAFLIKSSKGNKYADKCLLPHLYTYSNRDQATSGNTRYKGFNQIKYPPACMNLNYDWDYIKNK